MLCHRRIKKKRDRERKETKKIRVYKTGYSRLVTHPHFLIHPTSQSLRIYLGSWETAHLPLTQPTLTLTSRLGKNFDFRWEVAREFTLSDPFFSLFQAFRQWRAVRSKESDEKQRGTGDPLPRFYFFALLFTSHRSPLSERLEQATIFWKSKPLPDRGVFRVTVRRKFSLPGRSFWGRVLNSLPGQFAWEATENNNHAGGTYKKKPKEEWVSSENGLESSLTSVPPFTLLYAPLSQFWQEGVFSSIPFSVVEKFITQKILHNIKTIKLFSQLQGQIKHESKNKHNNEVRHFPKAHNKRLILIWVY